jgi:Flavodoxin
LAALKVKDSRDVISMRALVVYESMYGNTRVIAGNIADGLRATHEVTLVPVTVATADLVARADLLVVGGPTHMHGLSTAASRQLAAKEAARAGSEVTLDAEAGGPGLREWLSGLADGQALAAAFDTRLTEIAVLTGRASHGIRRLLKRHGYRLVMPPESFLVSQRNILLNAEASRARRWGAAMGAAATIAHVPARARAA